MARKKSDNRTNTQVRVRMTLTEYICIKGLAYKLGTSMSELMRKGALDYGRRQVSLLAGREGKEDNCEVFV